MVDYDCIGEIAGGDQLDLLDNLYHWVVGMQQDDDGQWQPRPPFTYADCEERFKRIPLKGTVQELRELVESYQPNCVICGNHATIWYRDVETTERYPKSLAPRKQIITTDWVCNEHRRES